MPPWAIGGVEAALHLGDEVARLRDLQRAPQLGVGGVRLAVAQVRRRPSRRTGTAAAAPGRSGRTAPRGRGRARRRRRPARCPLVASKSLGTRLTRVVLPLPVPPMIAVTWPGSAIRLMSLSTGCAAPGYRNSTSRSSSLPRAASIATRPLRRPHVGLGVERLDDPLGADLGARHHDEHERRHHHRHQDLQQVGQERGQRADRHAAVGDQVSAEPEHGDAGEVQHQHDRGEHQRHQPAGAERHGEQVVVGDREPVPLAGSP